MTQGHPAIKASDAERDHAVARLREAAADGRLTLGEFADRTEQAYRARTRDELARLEADLPSAAPALPRRARKAHRLIVAIMSDTARRGRWRIGDHATALSVMGNMTLDLRDAVLSSPEVTIAVVNVMGNTHVIVPEGVSVDVGGVALLGHKRDSTRGDAEPGAPHVQITGLVLMGNLVVKQK